MHVFAVRLSVAPFLMLFVLAACGDDDVRGSGGTGTADGAVRDGGGVDGSIPGPGDGSLDGGNDLGDGGGVVDAGPLCTPRDQIPDPIVPVLSVGRACPAVGECAEIQDGTYEMASGCLETEALFTQVYGRCSAVMLSLAGSTVSATATVEGSEITRRVRGTVTAAASFPNACHGCRCSDLETDLHAAGVDASCSPVCNGGTCFCTVDATVSYEATDAEEALTTCFEDGVLHVEEPASAAALGGTFAYRAAEDFVTPEVCDGTDNDGNGSIDDGMLECPVCVEMGVCAGAYVGVCEGARGLRCRYTSPSYEQEEVTCDQLDNDCDGSVDEELDCREFCDGIDNDEDGTIDEAPVAEPACSPAGVCAGAAASCLGADGWVCGGGAAEPVEMTCGDGLDNDCNGLVDERCCAAGSARFVVAHFDDALSMGVISAVTLDGSMVDPLLTTPLQTNITPVVDEAAGKIYWANITEPESIQRANLDGSQVETVAPAGFQPRLVLDPVDRHLYWLDQSYGVKRLSLDAPGVVEDVFADGAFGLGIDVFHRKLYLGDAETDSIHRVNLDGTDRETVAAGGQNPDSIAIDYVRKKVYWTTIGGVMRADLDLTASEPFYATSYPGEVHVDSANGYVYWTESSQNRVARMAVDGTQPEYITTLASPRMGAVVACPSR